ncbi:hypothetical protein [Aquimarina hainanensis]
MNPSATGWIEKFLTDHHKHTTAGSLPTLDMAYLLLGKQVLSTVHRSKPL